jgi:hypothetical protein
MTELNHERLRVTDKHSRGPAAHPGLFRKPGGKDGGTIFEPVSGFDGC